MAIRKEFWRLAWPAAAEGLLLMLLTAADLLMVSALGNTAVAAVSIFSQPRMVILCVTRSYTESDGDARYLRPADERAWDGGGIAEQPEQGNCNVKSRRA
jgi:hypothetical protein